MKKLLFALSLIIISFAAIGCSDDDDDKTISFDELPEISKTFLDTHFQGQTARLVEKDNDGYDVYLNNKFKVEFDLSGEWDDVDGINQAVPTSILSLLPGAIMSYISENYPEQSVYEVNKEPFGFEIELSNNLELEFTPEGQFIRIDR